jgi:hypothetical protein
LAILGFCCRCCCCLRLLELCQGACAVAEQVGDGCADSSRVCRAGHRRERSTGRVKVGHAVVVPHVQDACSCEM